MPTGVGLVGTCCSWCGEAAVPEGTWGGCWESWGSEGCGSSGARAGCLPGSLGVILRNDRSTQPERWSLGCQPQAWSSRVRAVKADGAGGSRNPTVCVFFSGNRLRRGSKGVDLRSPKRPRPRERDAGEVKATGRRSRPCGLSQTGRRPRGWDKGGPQPSALRGQAPLGWDGRQTCVECSP